MNNGAHGIVRIVLLYEPTQDPRRRRPVPACGCHKGSVECPGRPGPRSHPPPRRQMVLRHRRSVRTGDTPCWAQPAVGARRRPSLLPNGERLEQSRSDSVILRVPRHVGKREESLVSIKWEPVISPTRASLSIHVWLPAARGALSAQCLHLRRGAPSASVYPYVSLAQYLTRARMTSSSKGRT